MRLPHMTTAILSLLCAVLITVSPASAFGEREQKLTMGVVAADSPDILRTSWTPILKDLSTALGTHVELAVLEDYAGVIWYLTNNKAQIAWMGNKAAINAVDRADSEIIVQTRTQYGAGYYAHLITLKDAPYDDERDVLDNAGDIIFGMGDPNSTSGFAVPGYYLFASQRIDPNQVFKRMIYNNHEGNFHAVADGSVDVATGNSSALGRYKARFPDEFDRIKIIWTSPRIPSDPILVRTDLDPALKRRITEFFMTYGQAGPDKTMEQVEREKTNLAARKWVGFVRSDNTQLDPIRRLELYKKRLRVERDPSLNTTVRKRRMAEIDAQLNALDTQ